MKFVEEHFTFHHLRNAPHKWFLALIIFPIHRAEMRYKHTYHLRFAHAKKLFILDSLLLLSTIILCAASLFWWLYDPTITELVHVDITAQVETDRLRSGDDVLLTVTYHNESDKTLLNPAFHISLPAGYLLSSVSVPFSNQENGTLLVPLDAVHPGDERSFTLSGQYYATLSDHTSVQARLVYTQDGRNVPESDVDRLLLTTRESSVTIGITSPAQIVPQTPTPVSITLTNAHDHELPPLRIDTASAGVSWSTSASSSIGEFSPTSGVWHIPALPANATATLVGEVQFVPPQNSPQIDWTVLSTILTEAGEIREHTKTATLDIARPVIAVSTAWSDKSTLLGDTPLLALQIKNTGNTPFENPAVVYAEKTYKTETTRIQPGETIPLSIPMTVRSDSIEDATNGPLFIPSLTFSSQVPGIPDFTYTKSFNAEPLRVGTSLSMSQSARYYTIEGDQLGRGPLPPQVGKETKYWVFVQIKNTVGTLEDIAYTVSLAPGAVWTGKSSVSRGGDITFTATSHTATWRAYTVNPYETIGIYYEVAITPDSSALGSIPLLVRESSVTATDPYVETTLSKSLGALSASLVGDPIGQAKGVVVR